MVDRLRSCFDIAAATVSGGYTKDMTGQYTGRKGARKPPSSGDNSPIADIFVSIGRSTVPAIRVLLWRGVATADFEDGFT
jgi:hypothetical protein